MFYKITKMISLFFDHLKFKAENKFCFITGISNLIIFPPKSDEQDDHIAPI